MDATPRRPRPAIFTPTHPQVLGSGILLAGASVFAWVNSAPLPVGVCVTLRATWALAATVFVVLVFARRRVLPPPTPPSRHAGTIYGASTTGMVVVIAVGHSLLTQHGEEGVTPALVAAAVGAHFIPFAAAFKAPVFTAIGVALLALGAAGMGLGLALGPGWASASAALSGIAMLTLGAAATVRR